MKEQPSLFMVRAGSNGEDEDLALESNLAIIGFNDIPSVAECKDFEAVYKLMEKTWPDKKPRAVQNYARQMWMFKAALEAGDLIVLPRKLTSQIAIGKVTGPYEYRKIGKDHRHVRSVKWLKSDLPRTVFKQDLLYSFGAFITVCRIKRNAEKTLKIEIDDDAFERLYGHKSHPIEVKKGQKIAVRVISQFGEESTKVLEA